MTGRATMLPILLVIVIMLLALIAIFTNQGDGPPIAADQNYPHVICTFVDYCEGDEGCTREPTHFVIYLAHANGQPRLELERFSPRLDLVSEDGDSKIYQSTGGQIEGTFTLFRDRALDFAGIGGNDAEGNPIEHYGAAECEPTFNP